MIWRLSEKMWWGDVAALGECGLSAKAVLNVSQNQRENYWGEFAKLPQAVPYFRLGRDDVDPVNDEYMGAVIAVLRIVESRNWFPLLVHCVAGHHRSPAVAIVAEHLFSGEPLADVRARAKALLPGMFTEMPFHASVMQWCEKHANP